MKRWALLFLLLVSCGHAPKPVVFTALDKERAAAEPVKDGSPVLWQKAEALRRKAEDAWNRGDSATAQLLGEHALAAYHHAVAVARLTAANTRASQIAGKLAKSSEAATADEAALKEVDADIGRLEATLAVRRDALAPSSSGKTDAAREAARWAATRANLAVADALCNGAALLAPKAKGLDDAKKVLAEVNAKANGKGDAPIDASTRARALCLKSLTNARAVVVNGAGSAGDALLASLGAAGFASTRDERGVVATVSQPFTGAKLNANGLARFEELGKLTKANPNFAIVIVVHDAAGSVDKKRAAERAEAVKQALTSTGADAVRIGTSTPGASLPAVEPNAKDAAKNERVEVIFVGG